MGWSGCGAGEGGGREQPSLGAAAGLVANLIPITSPCQVACAAADCLWLTAFTHPSDSTVRRQVWTISAATHGLYGRNTCAHRSGLRHPSIPRVLPQPSEMTVAELRQRGAAKKVQASGAAQRVAVAGRLGTLRARLLNCIERNSRVLEIERVRGERSGGEVLRSRSWAGSDSNIMIWG